MAVSSDYLNTRLNGEKFLEYPSLGYWPIAFTLSMSQKPSGFLALLPIALLGTGTVLITFLIGKALAGEKIGMMAGFILSTMLALSPCTGLYSRCSTSLLHNAQSILPCGRLPCVNEKLSFFAGLPPGNGRSFPFQGNHRGGYTRCHRRGLLADPKGLDVDQESPFDSRNSFLSATHPSLVWRRWVARRACCLSRGDPPKFLPLFFPLG